MEAAGCLVIAEDFGTARIDGLAQWVEDHPVVLVNQRAPTDRLRLTLAHELGHLCLHSTDVSEHMEAEANMFAAEFLMPSESIRPQLRNLTIGRLHDLKREWGVSMQAIIERAHDAGTLGPAQRMSFYKTFSARGWRTREPLSDELPPEIPRLGQTIGDALTARGWTLRDIASLAGFGDEDAQHPFRPARARMHAL